MKKFLIANLTVLLLILVASPRAAAQTEAPLQVPTSGLVYQPFGGAHTGVDITGYRSINDTNIVRAAAAGKVIYVDYDSGGYGHYVVIYHGVIRGKHLYTLYGHMGNKSDGTSFVTARRGQDVLAGTPLGRQGNSGNTGGPNTGIHLHWEVRVSDTPLLEAGNVLVWSAGRVTQLAAVSPEPYTGVSLSDRQTVTAPSYSPRTSAASWHPDGTLLNINSTIWLVEGGRRRGFQSSELFTSNGYNFSQPIDTTTSCLDTGVLINPPPRNRVFRQPGTDEIYYITERNWKRLFASYTAFRGYGYLDSDVIVYDLRDIPPDNSFPHIHTPFHEGTLIRRNNSDPVYVISNGNGRLIGDAQTFLRLGYRWKDVIVLSDEVFNTVGRDEAHPITSTLVDSCDDGQGGAPDEIAPSLSISAPSDGSSTSAAQITVSGTASDAGRGESGVSSVTVNGVRASNDTATQSGVANWSRTLTLSPGANTITVVAKDNSPAQNSSQQSITVTYSAEPPGGVQTLATGLSNPTDIATDGSEVFWAEYGSGTVKKVSVGGGAVTVLASGVFSPSGVAVDNNYVYFGESMGDNAANLKRVPKGGGTVTTLASGLGSVWRIAVNSSHIYWTDGYGGAVQKIPLGGGAVSTIATGTIAPIGITVSNSDVFWSEFNNPGTIKKVNLNGGSLTTLGNGSNTPGVATDGSHVYWTKNVMVNGGEINKVSVNGGATTVLASGLDYPYDLVVDATSVFWVENNLNGAVKQVSLNGGSPITLGSGLKEPVAIAADNSSVYWIERNTGGAGTGVVKKVAKGSVPADITVTVGTNPPGMTIRVDGSPYSSTRTFTWAPGSSHTISATSSQSGGTHTQYVLSNWSDGGAAEHVVTPTVNTTYTANYATQYFVAVNAQAGGTVSPPSGWYNSGQTLTITATPNGGFTFGGWTGSGGGSYTGANNPSAVTINGPITQTASFSACSYSVSPTSANFAAGGGQGAVQVTSGSGCAWGATSSAAWLSVTGGAGGSGGGTVSYSVSANTASSQRTATLSVAGQTVTVTQAGATSLTNLAQGKSATQSSTGWGGVASRAVDGNTGGDWMNNSVTTTFSESEAWWAVDLGAVGQIDNVRVWNRSDCCTNRLANFYVLVSDQPFASANLSATLSQAGVSAFHVGGEAGRPTQVAVGRTGRYVRVQLVGANYLSLAEVQVMGQPSSPSQTVNLALGKSAAQSSTGWGAVAARAVDGNTSGDWAQNSVTATLNDTQAWWEVDLGAVGTLQNVKLWNRTDCCAERLSDFYVLVSDAPFASHDLQATLAQAGVSSYRTTGAAGTSATISVGRTGRYVRVQLGGTNYLSLAEVQVWGTSSLIQTHLAYGKPAAQSSTYADAAAGRAADGNTDGNYMRGSVSVTNNDYQAWWQVDLQSAQPISTVKVWNRTDCCGDRLSNFYVLVSDQPFASTDLVTTLNEVGVSAYYTSGQAGVPTVVGVNRTGRYVRVQLTGTNYLQLGEVQVWGTPQRPD